MTYTRVCARFPTRAAAERALGWAGSVYSFELRVERHACSKPSHVHSPWLLVSIVEIADEDLPAHAREPATAES